MVSATADSAELSEARSLRKFHRVLGGKGWRRKNGWSAADHDAPQFGLNDYDGVTVGPGGRVNQIRLRDNNLSATIFLRHSENFPRFNRWSCLSGLRFLTVLDVSNNSLRGAHRTASCAPVRSPANVMSAKLFHRCGNLLSGR